MIFPKYNLEVWCACAGRLPACRTLVLAMAGRLLTVGTGHRNDDMIIALPQFEAPWAGRDKTRRRRGCEIAKRIHEYHRNKLAV